MQEIRVLLGYRASTYRRMAEVRYIKTRIWRDSWFSQLPKDAQHLFIFLVTNEATRLSGFYEMPLSDIAYHTKTKPTQLKSLLKIVETKVLLIDGWVCIKNYAEHQNAANSPKIKKLIEYELAKVPLEVQKKATEFFIHNSHSHSYSHSEGIDRVSIPHVSVKEKEEKNEEKQEEKHAFGEFKNVYLTIPEKEKLKELYGVSTAKKLVEDLSQYIKSHGYEKKYKDHYATMRGFARRDGIQVIEKPKVAPKEPERPQTPEEKKKAEEMRSKVASFVRTGMKKMPKSE